MSEALIEVWIPYQGSQYRNIYTTERVQRIQYLDYLDHYAVHVRLALAKLNVKQRQSLGLLLFFFFSLYFFFSYSIPDVSCSSQYLLPNNAYESRLGPDQDFRYV